MLYKSGLWIILVLGVNLFGYMAFWALCFESAGH